MTFSQLDKNLVSVIRT